MDPKAVITIILSLPFVFYIALLIFQHFLSPNHEPNEPPLLSQPIPYLGHALRLFFEGSKYFQTTR